MVHSNDNRHSTQSERQTLQEEKERGEGEARNSDIWWQKQKQKEMTGVETNNLTRVRCVIHLVIL